jgi:hypothetical protein
MTQEVYVMRIWHNAGDSENWRVTVTDTRNQQKYNFANLDKLVDFLKERLGETVKPSQSMNTPTG